MKNFTIIPSSYIRDFTLTDEGKTVGTMIFPKWHSSKAEITIGESVYKMEGKGFWRTRYEITKDGRVVLESEIKWNSRVVITPHSNPSHFYTFKHSGKFNNIYWLTDYKGSQLVQCTADFKWKKFNIQYIISCEDNFTDDEFNILLLMLTVYHYKGRQQQAQMAT
jgi:hypothetical protein